MRIVILSMLLTAQVFAECQYAISDSGTPKYGESFSHFSYVSLHFFYYLLGRNYLDAEKIELKIE